MRLLLAGFLTFLLPSVAFAQARGEVESIGFLGAYRPGAWTPMVIRLTPTTSSQFTGLIEVIQEDIDRDQVIFTRQIVLDGNPENGPTREARFWMYFIPQPTKDKGELDTVLSNAELSERIKVRLCGENGKELAKLPITRGIQSVESTRGGNNSDPRGQRTVLCVHDTHIPRFSEFQSMTGLTENLSVIQVHDVNFGLPDNVIGYDAIDSIVWTDADPTVLSNDQLTAIEDFVRRGGKLVICQDTATNQWQRNGLKFPLLLPVTVTGVEDRDDHSLTLRLLAGVGVTPANKPPTQSQLDWDRIKGPFRYAVAQVKPGSLVVSWQIAGPDGEPLMDAAGNPRPYIVRKPFGSGSVTWVAQDLGDKQVQGTGALLDAPSSGRGFFTTRGWTNVWDKVLDWPNEPVPQKTQQTTNDRATNPYAGGTTWELGRSFLEYMDLPGTSAALIGIAVLFFIVYWVGAGPGSYLILSRRGRASLSWFAFAAIAICATALTAGIVRLVLRGSPQLAHVSLVRVAPGAPIMVHSDIGLYIPRDGDQKIELKGAAAGKASYITAFNLHPAFVGDAAEFPARQDYTIPVKEVSGQVSLDPRTINVPYRSTLKKFQAEWIGDKLPGLSGEIDGTVRLEEEVPKVAGELTNNTGHDLRMVYLVVNHPNVDLTKMTDREQDMVLFVSYWPNGGKVSLTKQFSRLTEGGARFIMANDINGPVKLFDADAPTKAIVYQGRIARDDRVSAGNWLDVWLERGSFRHVASYVDNREYTETDRLSPNSFPILSFFDRLPVTRNEIEISNGQIKKNNRSNFLRRGVRGYDISAAISAGGMAIIAVSAAKNEELPFELDVRGDRIKGQGVIYYQFVVPVDRSAVSKPPRPPAHPATPPKQGKA